MQQLLARLPSASGGWHRCVEPPLLHNRAHSTPAHFQPPPRAVRSLTCCCCHPLALSMGGRGSKVVEPEDARGKNKSTQHAHTHHKLLEEELKEETTTISPPSANESSPQPSPSPSPSSSPSPVPASPSPSPSASSSTADSPSASPVLRRRVNATNSASRPHVSSRSHYYRHEVESDSDDEASRRAPPRPPPRRRCEFLHRRHFFLLSVISFLTASYLTSLPQSEYFSELQLSAYLPEQVQDSFSRLQHLVSDSTRPGLLAKESGIHAHFPVVLIPGIISTALEVWEGEACARPHFRQRLWGSALMLRSILLDTRCWIRHMTLDSETGMDPPGIKLRSSAGLEAADYLIGGFWVWAKVIESLADIGYDTNSMYMAAYDWRLSFKHLQLRDWYFTKLRAQIEIALASNRQRKVVLVTHSMGALVVHYFMQWVQSAQGGNAGDRWVDRHIESIVNIGGPMLGVPKAWSALFSGEMKDTAELAPFLDYWRQRVVFSQSDVVQIMRSVFSVPSMMPKGGDVIWGDGQGSPDDFFCEKYAKVTQLLIAGGKDADDIDEDIAQEYCEALPQLNRSASRHSATAAPASTSASASSPSSPAAGGAELSDAEKAAAKEYAEGKLRTERQGHSVGQSLADMLEDSFLRHPSRWWTSHKEQKPYVSSKGSARGSFVTLTSDHSDHGEDDSADCLASGGCDKTIDEAMALLRRTAPKYMNFTEQLYSFGADVDNTEPDDQRHWSNPLESPLPWAPDLKIFCFYGVGRETERGYMYRHVPTPTPSEDHLVPHWAINSSHTVDDLNVRSGVKFTDGDGTVPLISLGFMCSAGWKGERLNPSGATIVTREYLEVNATLAILRAATSTDHVDIMGNSEIIKDLLRVVGVKRRTDPAGEAAAVEAEKQRLMERRGHDIEQENEGVKEEDKGPRTQSDSEDAASAFHEEPQRDAAAPVVDAVNSTSAAEDSDWEFTYIGIKDRVLSCVREISAEAQRRLLTKLGLGHAEVERRVKATMEQKATQDPYLKEDKGRKAFAASLV